MSIEIRPARVADIPQMASLSIQAMGGFAEIMYEGAIPGRTVQQLVEHRLSRAGETSSFVNSRIAEDEGAVLGGLHAFPKDHAAEDRDDLLIPEAVFHIFEPFQKLEAPGSYYINVVAVYPEYRGQGVARRLMAAAESEARSQGFETASLHVYAENHGAVALYEKLGYREIGRQPLIPDPRLYFGGDLLLMARVF